MALTRVKFSLTHAVSLFSQALLETRSFINGEFPTFTCKKGKGEGWPSRMGYTWVSVSWFSVLFYIWFLYMYQVSADHSFRRIASCIDHWLTTFRFFDLQLIGRSGPSAFFSFVFVTEHLFNMRSITWVVSILTPTIAIIFDVTGKVFSNIFFPTQSQIHAEIEAQERKASWKNNGQCG